jgi:hypothetical protein
VVKAFESASWFKDEFGILGKKDQGKKHTPPKELFNLDGNESYKTIHDRHKRQKELVGTPPRTNKTTKKVIGIEDGNKDEASKEEDSKSLENNGSEEDNDKNTRDSASQMSIDPNWETTRATEGRTPRAPRVLTPADLTRMPQARPVADSLLQLSPLIHGGDTVHGIKWKRGQWS